MVDERTGGIGIWPPLPPDVTLRDWMAMFAMMQTWRAMARGEGPDGKPQSGGLTYAEIADLCYRMADAMLAERAK